MSASDPYASYGGSVAQGGGADPYAAYGGKVAAPVETPQPDNRSLLQKAKDEFDQTTAPDSKDSLGRFALKRVISGVLSPIVHPVDTVVGTAKLLKQGADSVMMSGAGGMDAGTNARMATGPAAELVQRTKDDYKQGGIVRAGTGLAADAAGAAVGGKVLEAAPRIVRAAPDVARAAAEVPGNVAQSAARVVAGKNLDTPVFGDSITPRELYDTAKGMGVNLDTAQATGSAVTKGAKGFTEHSLLGSSKFEANKAANTQALHIEAEKMLDSAAPQAMDREAFGNAAQQALIEHQKDLNADAGEIYKTLEERVGAAKPDAAAVRSTAESIVKENRGYFAAHPEVLSGADLKAWNIVKSLAENEKPATLAGFLDSPDSEFAAPKKEAAAHQDSWSDLHKLRSDLLDITRGKDMVGTRATGWIKQLTGSVDDAMTNPKGIPADAVEEFRRANDIYSQMKATYDDPTSTLYHVVRAKDGLTAANTLAKVTPEVARKVAQAVPELAPQMQRQVLSRTLSPAGNEVPDLQNLHSRFTRAQKEQLRGILSPDQMQRLENLGRVAKVVYADSNSSGTAKVGQKVVEGGALLRGGLGVATLNPVAAAEGLGVPIAQRVIAGALNNPKFTEAVMNSGKGRAGWVNSGEAKLSSHVSADASSGITAADVAKLRSSTRGQEILMKASGVTPGSAMMKSLSKQAASLLNP